MLEQLTYVPVTTQSNVDDELLRREELLDVAAFRAVRSRRRSPCGGVDSVSGAADGLRDIVPLASQSVMDVIHGYLKNTHAPEPDADSRKTDEPLSMLQGRQDTHLMPVVSNCVAQTPPPEEPKSGP